MRLRAAVVAALVAVVALSVWPGGAATHDDKWCEQDLVTVMLGTGNLGIQESVLNGVNHVDVPFPACSAGGFTLDHTSDGTILFHKHCSEKFLRVYATAGATGAKAIINWQDAAC